MVLTRSFASLGQPTYGIGPGRRSSTPVLDFGRKGLYGSVSVEFTIRSRGTKGRNLPRWVNGLVTVSQEFQRPFCPNFPSFGAMTDVQPE